MHLQEVRSMPREKGRTLIAQNKKARHDYSIEDVFEAGMVLTGTEVKSLRAGRASLVDGYATIDDGEVWLRGIHIPEYNMGTWTNHDPRRARKLLLRREEVRRLVGTMKESGFTLVPLALYFKDGYAKVEIAVARGRKAYDKRQAIAERESKRETERALGRVRRGE
jgi:SsrA-binding protein